MQKSAPPMSLHLVGEERAEDQLDRLAETLRQTVARAAQLEALEEATGLESPQLGWTSSRNSEAVDREWETKTPGSQSDLGCADCEEVEEYWRGLLDRAMMEQEDIRTFALILLQRTNKPILRPSPYPRKSNLAPVLTLSLTSVPVSSLSHPSPDPSLLPSPTSLEPSYQSDLDEAYYRLHYYQKHTLPRDVSRGIEEERRYLRRVGQIRRYEIEKLEQARRELERTKEELREEVRKVRIARELIFKERNHHIHSSISLSPFPESPFQPLDFDYLSKEISLAIDGIDWEKPAKCIERKGEIGDLELRCKLAIAKIEEKTGNLDTIQREITSISQSISLLNPRLFGIRRIQTLLVFAQSKLSAQLSHFQLKKANKSLQELSKSLSKLEKKGENEGELGKMAQNPPRQSLEFCTTASTFPNLNDSCFSTPCLEAKCSVSKWTNLIETVKTQEEVIGKLKEELGNAKIRLKEMDMREIRVREREIGLKSTEQQLILLRQYMEQRIKEINGKEERLKVRERAILGVIAAGDSLSPVKTRVLDMRETLEKEEIRLQAERNAVEQQHFKVQSSQEALTCKGRYLHSLQRLLARQHSLQQLQKAKFESIRGDLMRLLPTLQRCEV